MIHEKMRHLGVSPHPPSLWMAQALTGYDGVYTKHPLPEARKILSFPLLLYELPEAAIAKNFSFMK